MTRRAWLWAAAVLGTAGGAGAFFVEEYKSGIVWSEPPVVDPGGPETPPSDAIVLFADDLSAWEGGENWDVRDGVASSAGRGGITSKQSFGDVQLHVEWASPEKVEGNGQGRGNSGIYFMGRYEVQVLDSFENETYFDGQAGAVYKQWPPLVNASRRPGEWQTYDILFEAPRFDAEGTLVRPAFVTMFHNGVAVQCHTELVGGTFYDRPPQYEPHPEKLPIHIQDHGNPVRFRNIWLREIVRSEPEFPKP